jgi:threonine/homoserine/homoserine lactone efflux protein
MLGITGFSFFLIAVLLLNITPGPDTAYIVAHSVSQGRRAGFVSVLGISTGCIVHTLATAFGLTAILAASAAAFTVIKIAGAGYLIYLGVRMIFSKKHATPASTASTAAQADAANLSVAFRAADDGRMDRINPAAVPANAPKSLRSLYVQGFWTNVLNPKVVLFFVSFFPQFVSADSPHKTLAFLALGATFIGMSIVWNGFVAWIAGSVTNKMRGRPGIKRWLDRTIGTAFVGLGIRLALIHR